jgi:hypothetical protein
MLALGQKNEAVTSRFCIEPALRVQGRRTCTILNGEEPARPHGSRSFTYRKMGYFSKLEASPALEKIQAA